MNRLLGHRTCLLSIFGTLRRAPPSGDNGTDFSFSQLMTFSPVLYRVQQFSGRVPEASLRPLAPRQRLPQTVSLACEATGTARIE